MSTTATPNGLEEKVAVSLARFDKAVKESNTWSTSLYGTRVRPKNTEFTRDTDSNTQLGDSAGSRFRGKSTCRPWDYRDFKERLGTYTPLKWFAKPFSASPPLCARYGWINEGQNALRCQCCGASLRYQYSPDEQSGAPTNPPSFLSRIKSQHHDLCPWSGNACPKEFLALPPMAGDNLREEFLTRLSTLLDLTRSTRLPEVILPDHFDKYCPGGLSTLVTKTRTIMSDEDFSSPLITREEATAGQASEGNNHVDGVSTLPADRVNRKRQRDEVISNAAALSLFGWRSALIEAAPPSTEDGAGEVSENTVHRLCCTLCNRRLVTDNFSALDIPLTSSVGCRTDNNSSTSGCSPQSRKRRRLSGGGTPLKAMDLVSEHRSFCPWAIVHPVVEGETKNEGVVPGWRQSLEAILQAPSKEMSLHPVEAEPDQETSSAGGDPTIKAEEALHKVQEVLGVLMRC